MMSQMLRQCRKPTGWLGRMVARGMNRSHSDMTDWGLDQIAIGNCDAILDVGCGGGGTIRKLAKRAGSGRVYGIDYSEESVRVATRTSKRLIAAGRVEIRHSSVSSLPFPDDTFDLVTAIETHYFWPDLVHDMREVLRVLKPGGLLLILGGEYKGGKYDRRNERWVELGDMAYHTVEEFDQIFRDVGLSEVRVVEDSDRGWMCGMGRKPQISCVQEGQTHG